MPRPQFQPCPICGKGFGSASIDIHLPQCYDKAIKRWRLNPTGPAPVMPGTGPKGSGRGGGGRQGSSSAAGSRSTGRFGASSALQSVGGSGPPQLEEYPSENGNLHPCSRCGRKFYYDRIEYHESVCKGDVKRRQFNSRQQRLAELREEGLVPPGGNSMGKGRKGVGSMSEAPLRPTNSLRTKQSTWRQQHEDFVRAIREARRYQKEVDSGAGMWSTSSTRAATTSVRAKPGSSARFGESVPQVRSRLQQQQQQRALRKQATANDFSGARQLPMGGSARGSQSERVTNRTSVERGPSVGAPGIRGSAGPRRSNQHRLSGAPLRPGPPARAAFGGGSPRSSAGLGGGGGGGRIINDNTTSLGMLQAFGRA